MCPKLRPKRKNTRKLKKNVLKSKPSFQNWSLFAPFLGALGAFSRYVGLSWRHLATTWRQNAPKERHLGAKTRQKSPILAPRRAKRAPSWHQDAPKEPHLDAKTRQKRTSWRQETSEAKKHQKTREKRAPSLQT